MAIDIQQLLSLLTSAGGGALSANAAGGASNDLSKLLASLQNNQLNPSTLSGPGGQSAGLFTGANGTSGSSTDNGFRINPGGGVSQLIPGGGTSTGAGTYGSNISLGNLDPAYNGLVNFGTSKLGQATGMSGLPAGVAAAGANVAGLQTGQPFQQGLANTAFAGAQTQAGLAGQGFPQVYQSTLDALRANAAPDNLLAANHLQDSLFGSGQLGTTGGGLLATAFGKGLGQADSTYQLQAQQAAMAQQQNALGLSQGLAGIGSGVTSLGENLTQGLFNRGQQVFGNEVNTAQLPGALQGQQLGLGLQGLAGASALNQQGLSNFQASLAAAVAQANAKNATVNAQANVAGTKAAQPTSGDIWGQVLTGLGSRLGDPNSGLNGILNNIFGGGGSDLSQVGGVSDINNALYGPGGNFSDWLGGLSGDGFSSAGGEAAKAIGSAGSSLLSNVPGISAGDTFASFSPGAAASIDSANSGTSNMFGNVGNSLGLVGGLAEGGTQGYGKAVASGASLAANSGLISGTTGNVLGAIGNAASGNYAGAVANGVSAAGSSGSALGATIAGSGLATAIPIAAIGFAAANWANSAGKKDDARNAAASNMLASLGWNTAAGPTARSAYTLIKSPDGQYYNIGNNDNFNTFARAVTSGGSQEQIQTAWQKFLSENVNTKYKGP